MKKYFYKKTFRGEEPITVINLLKNILKKTPIYPFLFRFKKAKIINNWKKMGKPIPPPHLIKQETVKEYAYKFSTEIFIETGTYHGAMILGTKKIFNQIYSIELDKDLYLKAKKLFRKYDNIHILQGDSSKVLPELLDKIKKPCYFGLMDIILEV